LHRTDGPAVELADGTQEWWLEGERYDLGEYTIKTANILQKTLDSMDAQQLQQVATVVSRMLKLRGSQDMLPDTSAEPIENKGSLTSTRTQGRFSKFL
jgi:hypothetical protein